MSTSNIRSLSAAILLAGVAVPAVAQSIVVPTANIITTAGSSSAVLGGQTFVNKGLVGVGRLSASTRDFAGETLGSFSAMALDLSAWRRNPDGSYSGIMTTLPDRGPNDVGPFVGSTDYRNRVHVSALAFTPYAGAAALPQSIASQNQLAITPTGGFFLTDASGKPMTGKDPGANVLTSGGIVYPSPANGEGAGRISLDAEGIAYQRDGSFWISDEYAAGLYHFSNAGKLIGAIQTVPALLPRTAGAINFNSVSPPVTGRRNNQGLEAIAVTPNDQRLVTILQSATVQDTNGANQQTRNNTRLLVYDITGAAAPTNPVGHYVLQLPIFALNGDGVINRTAAQSEMLALNDSQFLVLARDGIGRGSGASVTNTPIFKSVLLVDTTGATNLAGTAFETGTAPVAVNGTLSAAIKPVQQVELVNMLNTVQLGRFGMNLNTAPSNATSLSEKWEAMGLVPVLEDAAPQDFFLLVGNDNDFQAQNGFINGQPFNAGLTGAGGTGNNDSVVLVYRLTLPTYVDPLALESMQNGAPITLGTVRSTAAAVGSITAPLMDRLSSLRRITEPQGYGNGISLWIDTGWQQNSIVRSDGLQLARPEGLRVAGGADYGFGPARLGVSVAYQQAADAVWEARYDAASTKVGVYGGVALANGLYGQASGGRSIDLKFDQISRPGA
ncbi:hypothetical protein GCM10011529_01570 [Polymorphobacter glacialis]|uniref:Phytase-like domain-containing protein n=1 Tax=Sandarakinorhabdus glacialis TaxID=1614636 RepID=A0A916ZI22_9SPHN|nr:esterase-like activity of phytase family protein [Polymorphobacter glacialis]GGD99138.1 hypothetical protein GCM10011529_01570 [Polymorphobacter glacialis]